MSNLKRRRFDAVEKVSILKRYFLGKEAVSDICDDIGIAPNQFYRWQKELFDNATGFFGRNKVKINGKIRKLELQIEELKSTLVHKNNVIAEVTEDYVKLKKNFGAI